MTIRIKRKRRQKRIRSKVSGTAKIPRLCVFRSANHIYCQLIDDEKGKTILAANDFEVDKKKSKKDDKYSGKSGIAYNVGKLIAERAKEKKIKKIVFDRNGFDYHGRVKALAEGAREGGLEF